MLALYLIIRTENPPQRVRESAWEDGGASVYLTLLFSLKILKWNPQGSVLCVVRKVQWKRQTGQVRALKIRKSKQPYRCQSGEEGMKADRKRGRSKGGSLELQVLVTVTSDKLE